MNEPSDHKMTYMQLWGLRRKAGFFAVTVRNSMYSMVLLIFARICYLFYTKDLSFTTRDGLVLVIPAFIIGTIIWVVHEVIYKKMNKSI